MNSAFQRLRQKVVDKYALNVNLFATEVNYTARGATDAESMVLKTDREKTTGRTRSGDNFDVGTNEVDETERIRVMGDATFIPKHGAKIVIPEDSDSRSFTYHGETEFRSDVHTVYIFERSRRLARGV